jgi:type IV secretory pathway component VirB8
MNESDLKVMGNKRSPHVMSYQILLNKVRYLQLMLASCLAIILACIIAIIIMLPLKKIDVRYVEFAQDEHVTPKVYGSKLDTTTKRLLVRSLLRSYVVDRHTIDHVSELDRFKKVKAMSTSNIFGIHKNLFYKVADGLEKGTRDIHILYDQPIEKGLHEIEFETIDTLAGKTERQQWVVKIKYFIPKSFEVTKDSELLNPLGLQIQGYHFTQKEKPNV